MKTCTTCGKSFTAHKTVRRCLTCRVSVALRGWSYTPDPYAVVEYRKDERLEPRRAA